MKINKYFAAILTILTMIFLSGAIRAANYVVTNTNDSSGGSLRNAITLANGTPADDTITFAFPANTPNCTSGGVCTIALSGGQFVIDSAATAGKLTITSASGFSKLIIDGNNASRVFYVSGGGDLTLDGVTVTRGSGAGSPQAGFGGGILSGGKVTITNSSVSGNNTPSNGGCGIASSGTLIITSSLISNNTSPQGTGGAICSDGVLKMENSTVSFNSAKYFTGGIVNGDYLDSVSSTMTIKNSTINNNTTGIGGCGGILNFGSYVTAGVPGILIIENSTISSNNGLSADGLSGSGGGVCNFNGTLTLTNSTVSNNSAYTGGGIVSSQFDPGTSNNYLRNSIVAANTATNGQPDIKKDNNIFFISRGNNLIGNSSDTFSAISWNATPGTADILNQSAQLAPLANNGGATQTQALLANSPAINKGNNCVLTYSGCGANDPTIGLTLDQRGYYRADRIDIGAFEYNGMARKTLSDFDADRKADLSVFRPSDQVWYKLGSTAGFSAQTWGLSTDKLTPADFDGDGKTDLTVWRETSSDPDHSYFYIFQSATNTVRISQFGRIGDNPYFSGDWDGDGKADPTVFRDTGAGQTYFYYQPSSQPSVSFISVPWGISGDKPVRGDFDGDGKQDAAVFRPSDANWYILQSSNNQLRAESWGLATDKLIPADYDGDGKTDLAVLRNEVWYIRQSSDASFKAVSWGLSSDTAVPADYDGDGKTDIAVYRNGLWCIIQSSNNQISYGSFGSSTDIPIPLVNQ